MKNLRVKAIAPFCNERLLNDYSSNSKKEYVNRQKKADQELQNAYQRLFGRKQNMGVYHISLLKKM